MHGLHAFSHSGNVSDESTRVLTLMSHDYPHDHDHNHPHDHDHGGSELSAMDLRVRALESLLVEKGYIDPQTLDVYIETYEHRVGPRNSARDREGMERSGRLLEDATAAIGSLGYTGRQGEHMIALENTEQVHNMVVCTLCSCYPWSVLGLPPVWYKSAPYRSHTVIDPRDVLLDFGVTLPESVEVRVWDSTAEIRYLVLPMRPPGTAHLDEDALVELVTRDSMIGTGLALAPAQLMEGSRVMNAAHDMGGMQAFGAVTQDACDAPSASPFHAEWECRVLAITLAMGAIGQWNIDTSRAACESLPPTQYLGSSYYEIWFEGLKKLLAAKGLASMEEMASCVRLTSQKHRSA